jgi:hypothetical protein
MVNLIQFANHLFATVLPLNSSTVSEYVQVHVFVNIEI